MKILIWFFSFFVIGFLNEVLGAITGVKLGYMLIFVPIFLVSGALGKAWDKHKEKRTLANYKEPIPPPGARASVVKEVGIAAEKINPAAQPSIMFCRKCGSRLTDSSEFCSNCGAAVVKE